MKRVTNCRLNCMHSNVTTTKLDNVHNSASMLSKLRNKNDPNSAAALTQNRWNLATFSGKNEFFLSTDSQLNNDNSCGYRRTRREKKEEKCGYSGFATPRA